MGRPPLRKKGAFTPAERQARRRKRLAAERRSAASSAKRGPTHEPRVFGYSPPALNPLPPATSQDIADELVAQIAQVVGTGDTTLADIVASLKRRFGKMRGCVSAYTNALTNQ